MHRSVVAPGDRQHHVDARIVHQDVDPTVFGLRLLEGRSEGVCFADVAGHRRTARRAACQLRRQFVEQLFASRQTHDEGAPVGQGQSDGAADSRGGTRDHRDPPIEALWRSVPWHGDHHTVIWVRRLRSPPRTRVEGRLKLTAGSDRAPSVRQSIRPARG